MSFNMNECYGDLSNGYKPPKIKDNFIHYLISYVFLVYYYEQRFKRDVKYHKFTSLKGILDQLKKSNTFEYLVELKLNESITWEIREYTCSDTDIEYIKAHYE